MIANHNGWTYECVLVDLNTQRDFCDSNGARPVHNCQELMPTLRRMIAWTKRNQVPLISSLQSCRYGELSTSDRYSCCVDGSLGQQKIAFTVMPCRVQVEVDNTLTVSTELFDKCQQVIFRKRTEDLLANPKADRFLTNVPAQQFVVFGNSLEIDVKALTLGLLARYKSVAVVHDACGYWDAGRADLALRQMEAKGATVVTVEGLLERKLSRLYRYRDSGRVILRRNVVAKKNGNGRSSNGRLH
jgi:nicotinamidase-related amidase